MTSVLVLDDDIDLLEMVGMVLSRHKVKVRCISKATDLQTSIDEFKPDLLLMDIYLEDGDGLLLCHMLKTNTKYKQLPVLLYSAGHITASAIERSLANDYIPKPFDNKQLLEKISLLTAAA